MKSTAVIAAAVLLATAAFLVALPTDVDAVDLEYDREVYCYGDSPTFMHPMYDSMNIDWTVTGYDTEGNVVAVEGNEDENQGFHVSLVGLSYAVITQNVSHPMDGNVTASQTMLVHAMHIGDETYDVRFWNGSEIVDTVEITNETVIEVPGHFALPPEDPSREGFVFGGWYTDRSFVQNSLFDSRDVITGDLDVYAKWTAVDVPSGGNSGNISTGVYTVTFQCDTGLTYDILSNSNGTVTFQVLEESGYDVIWSTVNVDADYCNVGYSGGVYTLTGISSDIIVLITGEVVTSDNPEDPVPAGNDYTMFAVILIVLAVICIVLALYILRTRGSRV